MAAGSFTFICCGLGGGCGGSGGAGGFGAAAAGAPCAGGAPCPTDKTGYLGASFNGGTAAGGVAAPPPAAHSLRDSPPRSATVRPDRWHSCRCTGTAGGGTAAGGGCGAGGGAPFDVGGTHCATGTPFGMLPEAII